MDKELSPDLIQKDIVEKLYHYRQMIAESLEYSGHFRQLMETNVRFRVKTKQFSKELDRILQIRRPAYIHKLFDAFNLLRYNDISRLSDLFQKDRDIFNVYEKNIDKLTDLFSIYSNPKFILSHNIANQISQSSDAEVSTCVEMHASKAKL